MILYAIVFWVLSLIGWFVFRVVMTKTLGASFDGVHHSDAGWGGFIVPSTVMWFISSTAAIVMFGIGVVVVIDDVVGHWRAKHGKPEVAPLESVFTGMMKLLWKYLRPRKSKTAMTDAQGEMLDTIGFHTEPRVVDGYCDDYHLFGTYPILQGEMEIAVELEQLGLLESVSVACDTGWYCLTPNGYAAFYKWLHDAPS